MTPSETITKRRSEFAAAEAKNDETIANLLKLHADVEGRLGRARAEKLLNNAAVQTCDQLLKDLKDLTPEVKAEPSDGKPEAV